jgi:uncharacterized C2H2 Zn-finger protein
MSGKQAITVQGTAERRNQEDGSDKLICARCQTVMSRRSLKKPDNETGLTEVIYRCPKCAAIATRLIRD